MRQLARLFREQDGLETVEYAIILGLIVAGTVGIIAALGSWVHDKFQTVQTELGA